MILRPYQQQAVNTVYQHLREHDNNPCVVIPTGGGKTPVIATLCKDAVNQWKGRVLILAHVKELLEQAVDKLNVVAPEMWNQIGIYSAGLKCRDTEHPVIVAGIQSVYKRACELDAFDLIIIDECFVKGTLVSTPSGDKPIEQVQPGTFVCNATGIGRVMAVSAKNVTSLITLEYSDGTKITCTENHPIFTEAGWKTAGSLELGSLAFGIETMRMLHERISTLDQAESQRECCSSKGKVLDEAEVLLEILREDSRQSNASAICPKTSERNDEIQGAFPRQIPRREWKTDRSARKDAQSSWKRMGSGVCDSDQELQTKKITEGPENRSRESGVDDCNRNRRVQPQDERTECRGHSKNDLPGTKRLVSISHFKPTGGQVVFNLQVEGHPSYFANGILAHNCHMIPPDGEGMYRTFLEDTRKINPNARVIGLTATPFRMKSGMICEPDNILNHVCFEIGVKELIVDGYLCPLITKAGKEKVDTSGLHIRGGEFIAGEAEELMDTDELVDAACTEIIHQNRNRKSCLVFATGVKHGMHIAEVIKKKTGAEVGTVFGDTMSFMRDQTLDDFKNGKLKYLVNVNVLTMGFDAPNIDCVAMVRPTMSPGLYYQMVGRGFRLHTGKEDCLVLDFGGNVMRHGPVDQIRIRTIETRGEGEAPAKECPQCQALVATGFAVCPHCGFVFPEPENNQHDAEASTEGILSGQVSVEEYEVQDVYYSVHTKRDADDSAPKTLRVEYRVGWQQHHSEWVCFEHSGWARQKAESWWRQRSNAPLPNSVAEAVAMADQGALCETKSITVRSTTGDQYDRIVGYEHGDKPEWDEVNSHDQESEPEYAGIDDFDDDLIPF